MVWKWFMRFMRLRSYIVSPWKLLFNFKFLFWLIVLGFAYSQSPSSIQKPIRSAFSSAWEAFKSVAAELSCTRLINYGVDGVSEGVQFLQAPDAMLDSPGTHALYGGWPKGAQNTNMASWKGGAIAHFSSPYGGQWVSFSLDQHALDDLPWPKGALTRQRRQLLEQFQAKIQSYAIDEERIWVMLGHEKGNTASGRQEQVLALIVDEKKQQPRALAFDLTRAHQQRGGLSLYLTSPSSWKEAYGLSFFPEVKEEHRERLMAKAPQWIW